MWQQLNTARTSMDSCFQTILSLGLGMCRGPPGSPYFSAYVFFLYECLKSKVYIGCPENIVELKCHIQEEILAVSADIP